MIIKATLRESTSEHSPVSVSRPEAGVEPTQLLTTKPAAGMSYLIKQLFNAYERTPLCRLWVNSSSGQRSVRSPLINTSRSHEEVASKIDDFVWIKNDGCRVLIAVIRLRTTI